MARHTEASARRSMPRLTAARLGLFAGPIVAALIQIWPLPPGLSQEAWWAGSLAALMVIWWVSEALPVAVTALAPLAFLPLVGGQSIQAAAASYADPILFLLLGGFLIGAAVSRSALADRLALAIAVRAEGRARRILAAFMGAAALISLWVPSAVAALIFAPAAFAVARVLSGAEMDRALGGAFVLGVAYAALIGAIGAPISSPITLATLQFLNGVGAPMSTLGWTAQALPIMAVLLPLAWLLLTGPLRRQTPAEHERALVELTSRQSALGALSAGEIRLLIILSVIAFLWLFRPLLAFAPGLHELSDGGIAILGALALFLTPASRDEGPLLDWREAEGALPWGVLVMLGGGLALAGALETSGLAPWIGELVANANWGTLWGLVAALVIVTIFISEIASSVALIIAMLPIVAAVATATGVDVRALACPVAFAASLSFMLPMASGAKTIAFATGLVSLRRMLTIGLILNVAAIFTIVIVTRLATL